MTCGAVAEILVTPIIVALWREGDLDIMLGLWQVKVTCLLWLEELKDIKSDLLCVSEITRTGEAFVALSDGHILYLRGLEDRRECRVGFVNLAGKV